MYGGTISVEGDIEETEIVVRIPMPQETSSDVYYELGNME